MVSDVSTPSLARSPEDSLSEEGEEELSETLSSQFNQSPTRVNVEKASESS